MAPWVVIARRPRNILMYMEMWLECYKLIIDGDWSNLCKEYEVQRTAVPQSLWRI